MQTLKQGFEEGSFMTKLTEKLAQEWRSRLDVDCPQQSAASKESIVRWLFGDLQLETLNPSQLDIANSAMEYRYRILLQRYLGMSPERAHRNLITRLAGLVLLRNKIRTWVALSRDRSLSVVDVLQEVIQELLQSDRYMQQQLLSIAECTDNLKLRNALLFASTEEYCLRRIRNQPLILYRFVNYLRRITRAGITQVPNQDIVKLVSEEVLTEDNDNPSSLLDTQAIAEYQDRQSFVEQQALRTAVKQEFENYLAQKLEPVALKWFQLYLQGKTQEEIARSLNLDVKKVYRLREQVCYHAVRVFALKEQSELVGNWLEISLQEHSFGLTPQQWQQYLQKLTPKQRQLVELLKTGKNMSAIAEALHLQTHQVMGEWTKLYLSAQALRNQK